MTNDDSRSDAYSLRRQLRQAVMALHASQLLSTNNQELTYPEASLHSEPIIFIYLLTSTWFGPN